MKLVVGLGNPGSRYARTRHNVGFRVVECFARRHGIGVATDSFQGRFGRGELVAPDGARLGVGVLAPGTFMNLSGNAVAEALEALPVGDPCDDLLLVFDDVDLPFGRLRVRPGGGAGGHRGLGHVIERLGRRDLPRLRFGVGRPQEAMETTDWVLRPFSSEEEAALPERVEAAASAVETVLLEGIAPAMNLFNREVEAGTLGD